MAADKRRRARKGGRRPGDAHPSPPANGGADLAALEEIQRLLDVPLADLMATPEERAEAEELTRQAAAAPALARLREFVGKGRPATQAGNLKAPDAVALSRRLETGEQVPDEPRSMEDVPETAHAFRWAAAAGFLARRGTKIVAGPVARDLEHDPLAAWIKATVTLLEAGVVDGFQQGWRKSCQTPDGGQRLDSTRVSCRALHVVVSSAG